MFLEHSSANEAMLKFGDFNINMLRHSDIWGYKINLATRIIFRHFRENTLPHEIIANILNFAKLTQQLSKCLVELVFTTDPLSFFTLSFLQS